MRFILGLLFLLTSVTVTAQTDHYWIAHNGFEIIAESSTAGGTCSQLKPFGQAALEGAYPDDDPVLDSAYKPTKPSVSL